MVAQTFTPPLPRSTAGAERGAALAIAGSIAVVLALYGVYWARHLVPLPAEAAALAAVGGELALLRLLSVFAAMAALVMTWRIAGRFAGSAEAAVLGISFIFYPPLVATYAVLTPHALFALLLLGMLDVLLGSVAWVARGVIAGGLAIGALVLLPGAWPVILLWLMFCAVLIAPARRPPAFLASALAVVATAVLATPPGLVNETDLTAAGYDSVFTALALPYAMVIVGTLLSAIAALSARVRDVVGVRRTVAVLTGPFIACLALWTVAGSPGQLVTAAGLVFPFVLLAPLPLVIWVRRFMPGVKSLPAWLAFPVIMYSCFWVVLGPVKAERFPYTHRVHDTPVTP